MTSSTIQGTVLFLALLRDDHEPDRRHPLQRPRPAGALLMAPLLEVQDLKRPLRHRGRRRPGRRRRLVQRRAGQRAGHRRRVGLGQVRLLADRDGADAREQRRRSAARSCSTARDLLKASDDELRALRGDDIAMIFQDPLSSLHPFYKIGAQLVEAVRAHRDVSKAQALDRAVEMLGLVGIPDPRRRVDSYPHEFSGGMRQRVMIAMGADQRSEAADRRRADDGARRHGAGADPRADRAPAERAQTRRSC